MASISIDPNVLNGRPCFAGTTIPVSTLFNVLAAGKTIDDFLASAPGVKREQILRVLDIAERAIAAAGGK